VFLLFCPEHPHTARFLTAHEKRVAIERVRGNKSSLGSKEIKWNQVKEALFPWIDPQGWAYLCVKLCTLDPSPDPSPALHADEPSWIVMCMTIPNGGIANFLHLILQSYGYSAFQTILVGLPQAVLQIIFPLSGAYIARRFPNCRLYVMMAYVSTR
jgi:hypothetical protein